MYLSTLEVLVTFVVNQSQSSLHMTMLTRVESKDVISRNKACVELDCRMFYQA